LQVFSTTCLVLKLSGAVLACVALGACGHASVQRTPNQQIGVDAIRDAGAVAVLAEIQHGDEHRRALRAGVADLRNPRPVPLNSYYRIGSTTKAFTATLVMQLIGEGKLQLTDTVEQWLPGMVDRNGNDGRRITVKNLLRHTSGLNDWNNEVPLARDPTPERYLAERFHAYRPHEMVALALNKAPQWTPDAENPAEETRWAYSNTNYVLAGMIVEKVTGRPWEQAIHDRIIEPLGLRHTFTGVTAYVPQPHATAYLQFPGRDDLTDVSILVDGGSGDAGMISTPGDVATFFRALFNGRLVRPSELGQMRATVAAPTFDANPATRYGLGLAWRPVPGCPGGLWHHHGNSPGIASRNGVTANGQHAVALAISTQRANEQQLAQDSAADTFIDQTLCHS
jgi:D-alanyl-D-alanine carboxypeptidase